MSATFGLYAWAAQPGVWGTLSPHFWDPGVQGIQCKLPPHFWDPRVQGGRPTMKMIFLSIGADFWFEVPEQSSVGLIGGGRGQWLGGTMARECGAYNGGPGAEPRVRGAKPP